MPIDMRRVTWIGTTFVGQPQWAAIAHDIQLRFDLYLDHVVDCINTDVHDLDFGIVMYCFVRL